jgi:DNA-directed RNA polymerase specialized sigma24 family protein
MEWDQHEFEGFYAAARDDCLRVVLISVGDWQLAEDLVAEACIRRRARRSCGPRSTPSSSRCSPDSAC